MLLIIKCWIITVMSFSDDYLHLIQLIIFWYLKSHDFIQCIFLSFMLLLGRGRGRRGPNPRSPAGPQVTPSGRGVRSELKSSVQILKQRKQQQKQQFRQKGGMKNIRSKNKQWVGEVKKSGFGRGSHKKGKMRKKLWRPRRNNSAEGWCTMTRAADSQTSWDFISKIHRCHFFLVPLSFEDAPLNCSFRSAESPEFLWIKIYVFERTDSWIQI